MADVVVAFDSLIRGMLFGPEIDDQKVAGVLYRMGFGPEIMHELAVCLAEQPILDAANASEQLKSVDAEAHNDTWFTIQAAANQVQTVLGARPGDPL